MADRPAFDPSRIRFPGPLVGAGDTGQPTLSVRQVNELIRGVVLQHVPPTLHVLGEIGDLSRPGSGHVYFTLKDPFSELRCVMWKSSAAKLRFSLEPGLEVIATGGVEVYTPRGSYQLVVRRIEPCGAGALEIAFRQLRQRLEREGLFDPRRKRVLPRVPQRIGLITSPTGAAIRDILQSVQRRFPALEVLLFPVRVQGDGAAAEIAAAIRLMNANAAKLGGIDVAIVARGGGSLEDLWAFNEEVVARAVAGSEIPIVSGVGHEVDVTICDLAADVRAATPTAAAELVTPVLSELLTWLDRLKDRASRAAQHRVALERATLDRVAASDWLVRPRIRLRLHAQRVDEAQQRLRVALLEGFRACRARLGRADLRLARAAGATRLLRLAERLRSLQQRAGHAIELCLRHGEHHLSQRWLAFQRHAPDRRLARWDERLRQALQRLKLAQAGRFAQARARLDARVELAGALGPEKVLARGYSITRDARTGRILRSIGEVSPGQRICTTLSDGAFRGTADDPRQPRLFE